MGLTEKLQETRRKSERLGEKEHKRKENEKRREVEVGEK